MSWWFYLSFADPELPEGEQFLGGCYVEAGTLTDALTRSHSLDINPGGEVKALGPISGWDLEQRVPSSDRHRLLSREEIEAHG